MKRQRSWFLALLAMLWMAGAQQAKADDNQPRFMIPAAEFTGDGIGGMASITEKNPYFTIYLWTRNEDHKDSYWISAPELCIDGHKLTLYGLSGNSSFENGIGEFTCYDRNGVYYYVRTRGAFMAKDSYSFQAMFPDLKNKSNWDQDWYMPMDIIMYENHNSGDGEAHKVTIKGKAKLDTGDTDISAKGLDGYETQTNQRTQCPFTYTEATSSLEWTKPGQLTFTSCDFTSRNWGSYRVLLDDQTSKNENSGKIVVNKNYDSPDYKSNGTKKVEYRYEGVWNPNSPTSRYDGPVTKKVYVAGWINMTWQANYPFETSEGYARIAYSFDKTIMTDGSGIHINDDNTKLTIKCLNSRILKIRLLDYYDKEVATCSQESNPQYTLTMSVPACIIRNIEVTFQDNINYYPISFSEVNYRSPKTLPYPTDLTPSYNAWAKSITLKWKAANAKAGNREGVYHIFRDGTHIKEIEASTVSDNYEYTDGNADYDKKYTYKVTFVPNIDSWKNDENPYVEGLSASVDATLKRSVSLSDFQVTTQTDGFRLSWSIVPGLDGTGYKFNIYRRTLKDKQNLSGTDFTENDKIGTVAVESKSVTDYYYEDKAVTSTDTYCYFVTVNEVQGTTLTAGPTYTTGNPNGSRVGKLVASRGTYTDHVHLTWDAFMLGEDNLNCTIYRHQINENENWVNTVEDAQQLHWDEIKSFTSTKASPVNTYDDYSAVSGLYYAYAVVARVNNTDSISRVACDGFVRSTGQVSGSVTYADGKFAVEGVRLELQDNATTNSTSMFNALGFNGGKGGVHWSVSKEKVNNYFSGPFSVQMYVRPDADNNDNSCLLDMGGNLRLTLGNYDAAKGGYQLSANGSPSAHRIKADRFTHVTLTYDGNGIAVLHLMGPDSLAADSLVSQEFSLGNLQMTNADSLHVAVGSASDKSNAISGYVDEVRFFKRQLTVADVRQNYSHYMGGTESGLVAYWPFDEGISTMRHAYDYSKTGSTGNENHANIVGGWRTNVETPTPEQLALYAVTDTLGAYTLRGIPFTGEGTTYSLIPTKGVHSFSPVSKTIYVSPQTLTFEPQNFTDNSSFNVKGVVYYENTTYPVKGCRFRVDDVTIKDEWGNEILSDEKGEFTIPVSIGQHAIYIEKEGHTFLNNGRYPATGLHNFNDSISHLTFTDMTKAVVVGRVVGGAVEKGKPLGIGRSHANIGAATLTLYTSSSVEDSRLMNVYLDSISGTFESRDSVLRYKNASEYVNSSAWVDGTKTGSKDVKRITIQTDPNTGEFAVLLPPVPYYISTKVDNNTEATTYLSGQTLFDCSDVINTKTDTDSIRSMTYNSAFVQTYFSIPAISVAQSDNSVGAFGDARVPAGEMNDSVNAYEMKKDMLVYNYGYPIMTSCKKYIFDISAFEQYFNYDNDAEQPIEDRVPSTEGELTFKNPMVLTADTVANAKLDSLGCYVYEFQAIEPNEVEPYTQPIDITLTIGDNVYYWNWQNGDDEGALQCVVLGSKLTGNTSVTAAPDELINILRDPFGSNSNLVWNKGSQKSYGFDLSTAITVGLGSELSDSIAGGASYSEGAPGLYVYSDIGAGLGYSEGLSWEAKLNLNGKSNWAFTTSEEFQTSAEPYYDGPNGDVFIGTTSSLIYGDGLKVMLVNNQNNTYKVGTQEVIATAQRLNTRFAYTQDYIINQLIPNFKRLREARLIQVSSEDLATKRSSYINNSDSIIYMTDIKPDDPRFGTNNTDSLAWGDQALKSWELKWDKDNLCYYGPSYTVFLPASGQFKDEEEMWDAIVTINSNISLWEYYLALNEEGKVNTILNKEPKETYSFDSGSDISYTHSETTDATGNIGFSSTTNIYEKIGLGTKNKTTGMADVRSGSFNISFKHELNPSLILGQNFNDTYTINLSDKVADNFHEEKMFKADDGYSYIFYQTAGQTSRNYEGEKKTQYYMPNQYTLSEATVQVEVPHIDCEQPTVTGVPEGQPAIYTLRLSNPTMADISRNIDFDLWIDNDKWGKLAEVEVSGGTPQDNSWGIVLSPGDVAEVTLKVKPASTETIHIDSLHVYFSSAGQTSVNDDIYLAAHFMPTAEPVTLNTSRTLVNTATDSTLVLTASGYNINSSILNGVRLQQRKQGTPDWTTIHSWVKGTPAGDTESKLTTERIDTLVDMRSSIFYPDATYEFRAVTDCTLGSEAVVGESDIITVIKDVTLPQPIQLPEPADGVLGEGDNISITFNEDIYSQSLNEVDNFIIQSVLNTDSVAHDVALLLDGASTPAATSQSQLTLGGTSFTLCSWVKSSGTAGTLFRHGEGKNAFRVNIDADGYLSANIKDENGIAQTFTAAKPLPKDIWSYVATVYDVEAGTLSAYYASGDNEATLMDGVNVGKSASSEGNIYLGEGLTGAMHELSLFTEPLTWTTIKAQMYLGKSHSTPALIGYWRLDEGQGTKSEDRARSRHMQLADENHWYMENENLSMALDGTSCAAIPMGQLSVTEGVSYLVEMWALADESQDADAKLLSLDNGQKLDLNIVDGQLQLVADSIAYNSQLPSLNFTDHQWHHVALNVIKGGSGQANVIVDGTSVLTVSSQKVPALAGAKLWLGRNMKGMIDEVRLWHGPNTLETIADRMYYRMDGSKEKDLVGYWPMEYSYYDEYNQRVFVFSLNNLGFEATASTALTAEGTLSAGSEAPGLKSAPHKSNLDFSFVADERTVSITLDHSAEALEGCTVSTTLRNYYDLHTNVGDPITWSFVVKQNPLSWNTAEMNVSAPAGYSDTFEATLNNNGEADQQWSFKELPSWLEASPSSGTIFAHGSQEVTFTVKPGNAIGKYFTTVSACGNKGIDTPLDICLTVEGDRPSWKPANYDRSMTLTAQIRINGITSTDPSDMVGAFTDADGESLGECIGVGQPKYNTNKDAYYVLMMVFGTKAMEGDTIRFRLYDASTGLTYPLTTVKEKADAPERMGLAFQNNAAIGSSADPVILENRDKLLQTVNLAKGSNWISLYLKPVRKQATYLTKPVIGQISSVEFADGNEIGNKGGTWSGTDETISAGQMMIVNMYEEAILPVVGDAISPADYPITVKPGTNWIGVPSESYMKIDEAFAGLAPEEGDQVKSQTAFSTYENGTWSGDLKSIEPGKGYIYFSMADADKQFTFPVVQATQGMRRWGTTPAIDANYQYQHNMTVICTVHDEYGQFVKANSVEAYSAAGELRGRATSIFRDSLMQLVISGDNEGEPLLLKANVRGFDNGQYTTMLTFRKDQKVGSFQNPLVIGGGAATDISALVFGENSQLAVYNISGLLMYQGKAAQFDKSKLPLSAFYIILETTADGQTLCRKVKVEK